MAASRPMVSVQGADGGSGSGQLTLPAVFTAPIRPDIVQQVYRGSVKSARLIISCDRLCYYSHDAWVCETEADRCMCTELVMRSVCRKTVAVLTADTLLLCRSTLTWPRTRGSHMQSSLRQACRVVQSRGEQGVQCPVSPVCQVEELTGQDREHLEICVEEDACLPPPRPGEGGTERSTSTRRGAFLTVMSPSLHQNAAPTC